MNLEEIKESLWKPVFEEVFTPILKNKGAFYILEINTKYKGSDFLDFAIQNSNIFRIVRAKLIGQNWRVWVFTDLDFKSRGAKVYQYTFKLSFAREQKNYQSLVLNTINSIQWSEAKSQAGDKKTKSKSLFISVVNNTVFYSYNKKIFSYNLENRKSSEYSDIVQFSIFESKDINKIDFNFFENFIKNCL